MAVITNVFENLAGTPATPQFAEFILKGHSVEADGGSKNFVNIFHLARTAGPGISSEAALETAIMAILPSPLVAALSVAYVGDYVSTRFMDDPLRAPVLGANTVTGTVAGDRLPNYAAVVIRKNTYARGRSFRGSNHYGPIAESQTTLDNLNAGAITLWNAVAAALATIAAGLTLASGDVWKLAVFSPTLSNFISSPIAVTGSLVNLSTGLVLNTRMGTMTRRKDRTGPSA